jgi:hypothetical protein
MSRYVPLLLALACAEGDLPQQPPPAGLLLSASDMVVGAPAEVTVAGLYPNEKAYLILSTRGQGVGPCHPSGSPCADIRGPILPMGAAFGDSIGLATFQFVVPNTAPVGADVWFQGLTVLNDGATNSVVSNVVQRTVTAGASPERRRRRLLRRPHLRGQRAAR